MTIKKKLYTQSYFLIKSNPSYEYSFNIRLKYVGLNLFIASVCMWKVLANNRRALAAEGEVFAPEGKEMKYFIQ